MKNQISMLKWITLIASLLFATHLFSQSDEVSVNIIESGMPLNNINIIGRKAPEGETIGNKYLFSDFREGKISFKNEKFLNEALINYNAHDNYIHFKLGKFERVIEPEFIQSVRIEGDIFVPFLVKGYNTEDTYLGKLIFDTNKVNLIKYSEVTLKEPTYVEGLDMGSRDYVYKKKDSYFIKIGEKDFVKLKSSTNKNSKLLNRPDIKHLVKENHLDWNRESDLIKVAKYLSEN